MFSSVLAQKPVGLDYNPLPKLYRDDFAQVLSITPTSLLLTPDLTGNDSTLAKYKVEINALRPASDGSEAVAQSGGSVSLIVGFRYDLYRASPGFGDQ